ncbi:MAG: ATP-binding protein [Bacteroidetes bacterium]|nr:ATP-binding protein [Bacteroidota bacterium]
MGFWSFISETGIRPEYDDKLVKRIRLTNQFGFVALIVFVLSGVNNFILGDTFSAILIEILAIPSLSVFFFNKYGIHKFPTSLVLLTTTIAIFYFDSYSGLASGTFLYHFPMILAIAFVFDYHEEKALMLFHFFLPLTLLLVNVATKYSLFSSQYLTAEDKELMFMFNLIFSCSSIGFFMYLTVSNNIKESGIFQQRIDERRASEQAIQAALNEKEILLAEIHHRVKNNLAVIASLFNLQIHSIENEEAKSILTDSRNRVKSMALIHDSLYNSEKLSEIDFAKYTTELIAEIHSSYPSLANNIKLTTSISDVTLNVNSAIPCGLILNELLTNCYKHAFKGRTQGNIEVFLSKNEEQLINLKVKDDGVGLKADYDKNDSLGMVVINSLCDQLDGNCKYSVDNGTTFTMEFKQKITA